MTTGVGNAVLVVSAVGSLALVVALVAAVRSDTVLRAGAAVDVRLLYGRIDDALDAFLREAQQEGSTAPVGPDAAMARPYTIAASRLRRHVDESDVDTLAVADHDGIAVRTLELCRSLDRARQGFETRYAETNTEGVERAVAEARAVRHEAERLQAVIRGRGAS